ncbi:hypothetical protein DP17_2064 [Staphylococcus epidermidis]|nr:hypothetical protein DP17_2064 [Staphylococcus epidermidis]
MSKNIDFKNGYALGLIKSGLSKEGKKAIGMDSDFTSIQEKSEAYSKKSIEKQGINNRLKLHLMLFIIKIKRIASTIFTIL